jgi:ribulose-phosphate 3-epimerase
MAAGARVIHCDVMDGQFVPPITFGPMAVAALSDQVHDAGGVLDVHLMIERPERHVSDFVKAGADSITFHLEATPHLDYTANLIRNAGCAAGVAICPGTAVPALSGVSPILDHVLVMTVNPGWGGQPFIERSPDRVAETRALAPDPLIEVDGGVDATTAPLCVAAGATLLVAGSAVFGGGDPGDAYARILAAASG